ncbi:MAG TPA: Sec-independent protein translocase subunit TatA [Pseudonocardiaceae bacterium]
MAGLSVWHLLILLVVVVLLFGAQRLPDMARAVGQSVRIFKGEMKTTPADEHTTISGSAPTASSAVDQPHAPSAGSTHPHRSDPTQL